MFGLKNIYLGKFLILSLIFVIVSVGSAQKVDYLEKGGIGIDGLITIKFPTPQEIGATYTSECNLQTIDSIGFPVMCQQFGSQIFSSGIKKITKIGLRSIISSSIDPFGLLGDNDNVKKRIAIGTGLMIAGATIVATCPPISVNQGFHDLSRLEKLQQAQAFGYIPSAPPNFNLDVDNISDPQSCTATMNVSIDNTNRQVNDFGDFNEREFAYTAPFGSYPSATTDLAHVSAAFLYCTGALVSLVDISFGPSLSTDFGNVPSIDVNLDGILSGLVDLIIENIGLTGFELAALENFNSWKNNYRSQNPAYCTNNTCEFEHGFNRMTFYENMPASAWGNVTPSVEYYQDINVMEYFNPEITSLPLVVNLEALETGGVTVNAYPPRSFTGTPPANRNYTFDKSWLGIQDNCTSNPTLDFPVANFYPLGNWDIPITVTDRVGNVTTSTMRLVVEDSIPPDLLPLDAVGIPVADGTTVINFDDPGIGCVTNLCEGFPSTKYLHPPVYFDFASISPDIECYVENILYANPTACLVAQLPVNEISLLTWNIADPSGNVTEIYQEVFVREQSFNQVPTVTDVNITIGQNTQVQIPLFGNDADYDPLAFNIVDLPSNGNLDAQVEPLFQTRFTTSGMIQDVSGMIIVRNDFGERGTLLSVADEKRIYLYKGDLNSQSGEIVQRYDFSTITPSAITFSRTKYLDLGSTPMVDVLESADNAIWIGDWVNRKVYRYTYNRLSGVGVEKFIFNVPGNIQEPSGLIVTRNDANNQYQVLITDKANNKLWRSSVTKNTNSSNLTNQVYGYNYSAFIIDLPFSVDAMDHWKLNNVATDTGELLIASWSAKQLVWLDFDGGATQTWDISALLDDIDGPNAPRLPIMQDPRDFVLISDGPTRMKITLFDQAELKYTLKDFIKSNNAVVCGNGTASTTEPIDCSPNVEKDVLRFPGLVGILAIEEYNGLIYVLDKNNGFGQHLYRFDLAGRLDAVINLYSGAPSQNPMSPSSGTEFVDIALMNNGDILLLDKGNSSVNNIPVLERLTINSGVDEYISQQSIVLNTWNDSDTIALDVNATDIVVLAENGFTRIPLNSTSNQVLIASMTTAYNDLALSDTGLIYASNRSEAPLNHVTRFDINGNNSFLIGSNDLDFNNDSNYGRMYFDNALNKVWISDFANVYYPDLGANGATHRMPRMSAYDANGTLLERLIPDGDPNDFFSFLEPGDFGTITSIAAGPNRLYVAESAPLKRLHVFDTSEFIPVNCTNLPEGEVCQEIGYTPDNGFVGTETFTYGASDPFNADSNTATVTITVIDDQQAPVLTCPTSIELEMNNAAGFVADLDTPEKEPNTTMRNFLLAIAVSENTDLPVVEASHNIPAALPLGLTTITYSATDGSNNTGTCMTQITVVDTTVPTMGVLTTLTVEATGVQTPVANTGLIEPSVSDFSPFVLTSNAPATFAIGETVVTWTASDNQGNSVQQQQLVIVKDTTPPEFTVAALYPDIIGSSIETAISYSMPQAIDAVAINEAGIACIPAIGDVVSMGPTLVQCNVADKYGNKSSTSFTVNYYDNDTNTNGIIDILDMGNEQFSDAANGGQTNGEILDSGSFDLKIYEAPANKGVTIGLKTAYDGFPAAITACNSKIIMNNLNQETILFDDISVTVLDHVAITCLAAGYEVFSLLGNNDFNLTLPDNSTATATMEFNNGLVIDGWFATALSTNRMEIIISIVNEDYRLLPGQTVDLRIADLIFTDGFE